AVDRFSAARFTDSVPLNIGFPTVNMLCYCRFSRGLNQHPGNEIEPCGLYQSDLGWTTDPLYRSSVDAHADRIRTSKLRSNPSPRACRKHDPRGKLHARRTLGRPPAHRSRALLVSASLLVLLEEQAHPQSR